MSEKLNYTGAPEVAQPHELNARWNVHADPNAFGVGTFEAIHGLGEVGVEAALRKQALVNDIDHNKRALDTSQLFNEEWERMASKEGMAANDYLPKYHANMRNIYNNAVNDAPNDTVKKQLANTLYRDVDRWMSHGSNYAGTQLRSAHREIHTRALEQNANQVELMRNQPIDAIVHQAENGTGGVGGLNSVRERLHSMGIDPYDKDGKVNEANMATYKDEEAKHMGRTVAPLIDSLAENWENNPKDLYKADELFKATKDKMDAKTANFLERKLQPRLDKAFVQARADQVMPIPDESGYFPSNGNEQRRLELGIQSPSRENLSRIGGGAAQPSPVGMAAPADGDRHVSDHFAHLESGGKGIGYINMADTGGSHSYGNLGLNSRTKAMGDVWKTSAGRFWKQHPELGLEGIPGTPQADASWRKVAAEKGPQLRAAEKKFWEDEYLKPVAPGLKKAGVQDAIANSPKVQYYLADRNVQQGSGKILTEKGEAGSHSERFKEAARRADGDPDKFIKAMTALDKENLELDFPNALHPKDGSKPAYSEAGHNERLRGREEAAGLAAGGQAPATPTQPQPTAEPSLLAPGVGPRSAVHQSNLMKARAMSEGNPVRERMLYNELNRRSTLMKNNLAGERQHIDSIMKNMDLQASKGLPNLSLEDAGLTETQIRAAHADKPWMAEHIIESFRLQSHNADHISSLKFSSKADWDNYLRDTNSGLGVDTMIQNYRKKSQTQSAFDIGADPEAKGEIMSNDFALKEKIANTARKAYTDHFTEMNKDPIGYLLTNKNPAVLKAIDEANKAKDPADKASAFRSYSSTLISLQRQMGVPEDKLRVLTNAKAEEVVDGIMKSDDPKKDLDALKSNYGDLFHPVFKDLINQGKLPSKFEALLDLDNQNASLLAGRIKAEASVKGNEHERQMKKLLGDDVGKVGKAVRDGSKEWMTSLENRGVSEPARAEVMDTVIMLAEARIQHFGESASTASDAAVKAFTGKYKFTNDRVAIPADKYDAVMAEANDHLKFLDSDSIVVPHHVQELGHDNNWYVGSLQSTRSWKATPDGDGMYLVDHYGSPVLRKSQDIPSSEVYDEKTGKKRIIPGKPGKEDLIKVMFNDPKTSISAASPISRPPSLFFEALGD
jgi:hypothetical protein